MDEPDGGAAAAVYTCPMHPEVVSDEPGPLPELRDEAHRRGRPDGLRCPMHPRCTEETADHCPSAA